MDEKIRIAIIGYGRMGREIETTARSEGIEVVSIIDPAKDGATGKEITKETIGEAEIAIDFSSPGSVIENIKRVAGLKKNMVIGTTGWYGQMEEARRLIEKEGTGLIYSPNFSIGVNIFFQIVKEAASLIDKFPGYDPYVYELHHNQKTDAPGGTAKELGSIILQNIKRKKDMVFDRISDRRIDPAEVHVASIRAGQMPGTHVVGFDGPADTIELKHTARSRAGFSEGAIEAAKWIRGRKGFYSMKDLIESAVK